VAHGERTGRHSPRSSGRATGREELTGRIPGRTKMGRESEILSVPGWTWPGRPGALCASGLWGLNLLLASFITNSEVLFFLSVQKLFEVEFDSLIKFEPTK
jgi:hypothetical protein